MFGVAQIGVADYTFIKSAAGTTSSRIEVFEFISKGKNIEGKIYLPSTFNTSRHLPAIYLIDFTEQHFKIATDEFDKVINAVNQLKDFNALVVSLDGIPDIDAEPAVFEEHYDIYKDLANYVDSIYTGRMSA